jgi:hypothetical protein
MVGSAKKEGRKNVNAVFAILFFSFGFLDLGEPWVCVDIVSAPCGRTDVDFVYRETYCIDFLRFEVVLNGAGIDQKRADNGR